MSISYVRDADGVVAEPHWALAQRTRAVDLDYDAQFARARVTTFAGRPITMHAPEDLLLLLCVHGGKHEWERLGWIRDVAALLERSADLGLDLIGPLPCQGNRVARACCFSACRSPTSSWMHRFPRTSAGPSRRDPGVQPLVNHVIMSLFVRDRPPGGNAHISSFAFRMHERTVNRMKYVTRTLLLPRGEHIQMVTLPASLAWVYYPLRWAHDYIALPLWLLTRPLRKARGRREPAPSART